MNATPSRYDKENVHRGELLFPNEKLGRVPENSTMSGKKEKGIQPPARDKIANFELDSFLDGGEKRVAIIDPLQALNGRARIARKLLVSPLQVVSGKKRAVELQHTEGDTKKLKKTAVSQQALSNLDDQARLELFSGKSKPTTTKLEIEREFDIFFENINKVRCMDELKVFDSCPEVIAKINMFLKSYNLIDRSLLSRHLRVHGNAFNAFLLSQNQQKCDNVTYRRSYVFFEKLRIYFGEPKSAARLFNEIHYPNGFSLKKNTKKNVKQNLRSNHEFC